MDNELLMFLIFFNKKSYFHNSHMNETTRRRKWQHVNALAMLLLKAMWVHWRGDLEVARSTCVCVYRLNHIGTYSVAFVAAMFASWLAKCLAALFRVSDVLDIFKMRCATCTVWYK